ncbi:SIMPL domain-containing protein [Hydrogenophaga sp.]|uniref:SIMPL domain-containing protein n=1 Tax=Hydrogenophaga sp. TaxID=1904254 RepID=UPI0035ADBA2C
MSSVSRSLRPLARGASFALPLAFVMAAVSAQPVSSAPLANVVGISASSQREVPQDWLTLTLTTSRDGTEATVVQNQLRQALDAALAVARTQAAPKLLEVRTGAFGVYPRQGSNGRINGWQGTAELVLEGRDVLRITSIAGKIGSMGVGNVAFSLSRETQQALESEVQAAAIERFKSKAAEVAKAFGFEGYTLREVSVSPVEQGDRPVFARMRAASAAPMAADAPLPVEAGKSVVTITVSGSIQLR